MIVLSIDVGIKNLAFCLLEKHSSSDHFYIKKWNSINVGEKNISTCCFIEKKKICSKPAKFTKEDKCYCLKHSKKQNFLIPTSELKIQHIKKQKIQDLYKIANKYKISYEKTTKKSELIEMLNEYIHNVCFEPVVTTNASKIDIVTIGENIKMKFDEIFTPDIVSKFDYIIIENQISPIANRMKTIQGLITQYFIMKGNYDNIEFISAANKLKDDNKKDENKNDNKKDEKKDEKKDDNSGHDNNNSYANRKKLGIIKCLEHLNNQCSFHEMLDFFNQHSKKDDLADSFLQGLWFIKNNNL